MKSSKGKRPVEATIRRERAFVGAKFIGLALAAMLLINVPNPIGETLSDLLTKSTTLISSALMSLVRLPIAVDGATIHMPTETLVVTLECTAVYLMILYGALVIAYPSSARSKLVGVGLGIPAIFVINIARLLIVTAVAYLSPGIFKSVHDYVWQVLFVVIIVMLWIIWMERVVKLENKAALHG